MRGALILAGLAVGAYGVVLLFEFPPATIVRIAVWAAAAVVVHDFVFAPVCAAAGWAGRRLISGRWWLPVSVAGTCTVVLLLLAIPVYAKPGARPDNPTVLDRDYPLGLWLAVAVVWACVPIHWALTRLLPVRHHHAVQGDRADDVQRQPPAS